VIGNVLLAFSSSFWFWRLQLHLLLFSGFNKICVLVFNLISSSIILSFHYFIFIMFTHIAIFIFSSPFGSLHFYSQNNLLYTHSNNMFVPQSYPLYITLFSPISLYPFHFFPLIFSFWPNRMPSAKLLVSVVEEGSCY
jgi:hypothetical protein